MSAPAWVQNLTNEDITVKHDGNAYTVPAKKCIEIDGHVATFMYAKLEPRMTNVGMNPHPLKIHRDKPPADCELADIFEIDPPPPPRPPREDLSIHSPYKVKSMPDPETEPGIGEELPAAVRLQQMNPELLLREGSRRGLYNKGMRLSELCAKLLASGFTVEEAERLQNRTPSEGK